MHINYRIYTIIGKGKNEQTKTKLKYNALPNLFILFYFLITLLKAFAKLLNFYFAKYARVTCRLLAIFGLHESWKKFSFSLSVCECGRAAAYTASHAHTLFNFLKINNI